MDPNRNRSCEMNTLKTKTALMVVCAPLFLGPVLSACEEEGPAEQLGETVDETVEETGDALEDAADEVEQKVE
jgi:hypothetical protein